MSIIARDWAKSRPALTALQYRLLETMGEFAHERYGFECWASKDRLIAETGMPRSTLYDQQRVLVELGLIERVRWQGRCASYRLNIPPEYFEEWAAEQARRRADRMARIAARRAPPAGQPNPPAGRSNPPPGQSNPAAGHIPPPIPTESNSTGETPAPAPAAGPLPALDRQEDRMLQRMQTLVEAGKAPEIALSLCRSPGSGGSQAVEARFQHWRAARRGPTVGGMEEVSGDHFAQTRNRPDRGDLAYGVAAGPAGPSTADPLGRAVLL
jgi:hypothetical protein